MTRINDQCTGIGTDGFLLLAGGMVSATQSNPGRCRIRIKLRPQPEELQGIPRVVAAKAVMAHPDNILQACTISEAVYGTRGFRYEPGQENGCLARKDLPAVDNTGLSSYMFRRVYRSSGYSAGTP